MSVLLTADNVGKLEQFLERIKLDTYPEAPTELHTDITGKMLDHLDAKGLLQPGTRVLDIGCGQGVALERFAQRGLEALGITLNDSDIEACRAKGFDVQRMDQSFLDFPDASFDLLWCRHCLEHSIMPYFTLCEFNRVIAPGGYLYVEVPAPDTSCQHQLNPNHYSVFGKTMWASLMNRAGFVLQEAVDVSFTVGAGPDTYWSFILQKANPGAAALQPAQQ